MILALAKEYGQSPETVENWDEYWLERAALKIVGESEHRKRETQRLRKKRR